MSATALAAAEPLRWPGGVRFADRTIAFLVFLSGFVIVEPSPYDLLLVVVVIVWAIFGLKLNRYFLPMTILMMVYLAGGLLSLTQMDAITGKAVAYMATTAFLIASSIFFASVIVEDPEKRLPLIRKAYLVSAAVVSVIAILAYFNAFPHADYFKLYQRAKGTFQDPNVFGPFLALPVAFLVRDVLTRPLTRSLWQIFWLLVILFGVFLSFSRAAWGLVAFTIVAVAYLAFVNEARQLVRFRLVGYLVGGVAIIAVLVAGAISIPAVKDLYVQRAHVVQSYDDSRAGRFERQKAGFFLMQERPLGIGPEVFGTLFGEDEHNMWLKGFTTYGWLGGFAYIILAAWTLAAAAPLLFKPRPWQAIVQCTYVVFLGHIFIHNVIDNDHWRHLYLLYGMLWGAIAAEKMAARRRSPALAPASAIPSKM
ncbi:MAG: O-antigen ligase family protein [Bauldia sp.]